MRPIAPIAPLTRHDPNMRALALPMKCRDCAMQGTELCRVFREEAPRLTRPPTTRFFDRGQMVMAPGETPGFLGVLRRGYLRQERYRLNGDRVLLGLACPGDIVGGLPGMTADCASEAATDSEVCTFDSAAVERLMLKSPRFRQVILRDTDRQHHRLLGLAWQLNALDSRERIIAFLVEATKIMPTEPQPDGSLILRFELSRRDWADLTNTAVETISRTMRYLADKEMVISLTPSRFLIRDLDRLALLAAVDPPGRPGHRSDRREPVEADFAWPGSAKRMTTVNASVSGMSRICPIEKSRTARQRGDDKRRRHHVHEEVRD